MDTEKVSDEQNTAGEEQAALNSEISREGEEPVVSLESERPISDLEAAEDGTDVPTEEPEADASFKEETPEKPSPRRGSITISKLHLIIALLIVALLLVASLFLGMWLNREQPLDPDIDPNAKDYNDIHVNSGGASADNIAIPGYDGIIFPANETNVQVVLLNPSGNPCYFRFTLLLKETGEVLYQSKLVPPGQAVTDLTLNRPLEPGTYHLVIRVETASLTDRSAMNGADMETILTVR